MNTGTHYRSYHLWVWHTSVPQVLCRLSQYLQSCILVTHLASYRLSFWYLKWKQKVIYFHNVFTLNCWHTQLLVFSHFFLSFISFERKWKGLWVGRGRESQRERISSRLHAVSPDLGLKPTNLEIMSWTKIKCQMLNQLVKNQ